MSDHEHSHRHSHGSVTCLPRGEKAFTVGVAGPVGSGKTSLILSLCRALRDDYKLTVITNDIFTKQDWEYLVRSEALPEAQLQAVQTGACPHSAIREDISMNYNAAVDMTRQHSPDIIFVESGGDNLAATFSRELADLIVYVIDVAGGDKIPKKGGPGVTQSDVLVVNKVDLAEAVGASMEVMVSDAHRMRKGKHHMSTVLTEATHDKGIVELGNIITDGMTKFKDQAAM